MDGLVGGNRGLGVLSILWECYLSGIIIGFADKLLYCRPCRLIAMPQFWLSRAKTRHVFNTRVKEAMQMSTECNKILSTLAATAKLLQKCNPNIVEKLSEAHTKGVIKRIDKLTKAEELTCILQAVQELEENLERANMPLWEAIQWGRTYVRPQVRTHPPRSTP